MVINVNTVSFLVLMSLHGVINVVVVQYKECLPLTVYIFPLGKL